MYFDKMLGFLLASHRVTIEYGHIFVEHCVSGYFISIGSCHIIQEGRRAAIKSTDWCNDHQLFATNIHIESYNTVGRITNVFGYFDLIRG